MMAAEFTPIISNAHQQAASHLAWLMDTRTRAVKAQATVDDVAQGFGNDLGDLIQELLRGGHRLSKADFRRDMKKLVKDYARQVFEVGWEEGGGDVAEVESDDLALLEGFVNEQQNYVNDFSDWLTDKESDLDIVPDRVALWVASMMNLGQQAKARAMGNPRLTLRRRPGAPIPKAPCDTCAELENTTHTLAWWRGKNPDGADYTKRNGNEAYICGRWDEACYHSLFHARTGEKVID